MLRGNGKKVNSAFSLLNEKRRAVGNTYTEETPEQEAVRIERDMKAASEAGDIGTMLRIICSSSALKPADYIKKTVGELRFMYYLYIDKFHVKPIDITDMVDGLLYIDAKRYTTNICMEEMQAGGRKK